MQVKQIQNNLDKSLLIAKMFHCFDKKSIQLGISGFICANLSLTTLIVSDKKAKKGIS